MWRCGAGCGVRRGRHRRRRGRRGRCGRRGRRGRRDVWQPTGPRGQPRSAFAARLGPRRRGLERVRDPGRGGCL
ncbi:MAG: hypothetical protein EXR75_15855 [Myxococcales bacterium]|nr:hypothetical protein [Myxococcales bacterium]